MSDQCVFCKRINVPKTHGHHIIPKSKGGKETQPTCGACGSFIHATWTNNELRDEYNTVEKILNDDRFKRYLKWIQKQPSTVHFRTVRNNEKARGKYK